MGNLNYDLAQSTLHSSWFCAESILVGVRLVLPGNLVGKTSQYMQEHFYDDSGKFVASSSEFRYMPLESQYRNDQYFADVKSGLVPEAVKSAYQDSVKLVDGDTVIDLMISAQVLESIEDELGALTCDLNTFVEMGLAKCWRQLKLI